MVTAIAGDVPAEGPQQAAFSGRGDMVLAHATALDAQGRVAKGLTSADFIVKDNGVVVEGPTVMADSVPLAVAIVMNQEVIAYVRPVRALMDMLAALGPEDVMGASNVRGYKKMVLARDQSPIAWGIIPDREELIRNGVNWEQLARSPWDVIAEATQALEEWRGRRAILFLAGSEEWMAELTGRDPRWYSNGTPRLRPEPRPKVSKADVELTLERLGILLQVVRYDRGYDTDIDGLARVAGGTTYKFGAREPLADRVNEIAERLRGSYLLGFKPVRLDGKVHTLEIRTVRSDLKVTGRTQYRADR